MKFTVLASVYIKVKPNNLNLALESLYQQTLLPDEIVLVQDGPLTKDLESVIEKYKSKQPQILKTIALNENRGLGNALKIGVENCSYDIIARMDTDDICYPNR